MRKSDMADADMRRMVADAVEDARDGLLDSPRLSLVRDMLRTSSEARRCYLEYNTLSHLLASSGSPPATAGTSDEYFGTASAIGKNADNHLWRSVVRPRHLAAGGVLAAVAVFVLAVITRQDHERSAPPARAVALLEQLNGDVTLTTFGAETTTVNRPVEIRSGDTIRTQGALSSSVLKYPDGTRLTLVGNSSLTVADESHKRIVFHGGTMVGSVARQPAGQSVLVVTPQDKVHVLGTRFALEATAVETDLSVNEGHVRLTRLRDGKSVEINAGNRVVSNAASLLVAEAIPETPDQWSEDFENGLPVDWNLGEFATTALPRGSRGAVRAVRDVSTSDGTIAIATHEQWSHGLFAIHDDTHLHFTLKMQDPGWFNILILTRTADGDSPVFAGNYIFDRPVWSGRPGEWGTVSIPLTEFRPLAPARDAFRNAIPFQIVFSSPDRDRGIVLDRIWVARGGVGTVEVTSGAESSDTSQED